MKLYDGGTTVLIIVVVALLVGYASSQILDDDNPIEETAEVVIKQHTGVDLDLTPLSPEGKV